MQYDKTRIAIRERDLPDLLDLALHLVRAHWLALLTASLIGAAPFAVLNYWLLSDLPLVEVEDYNWYVFRMILLVLFELPLAAVPTTLLLGQAMFFARFDVGRIIRLAIDSLPQLLFYQLLLRGLLMPQALFWERFGRELASIMSVYSLFWVFPFVSWPFLNEMILLERNPLRTKGANRSTWNRSRLFHKGHYGDSFGRLLACALLAAAMTAALWLASWHVRGFFTQEYEVDATMFTVHLPVALWTVAGFFSVVRFLSYLDRRIRNEGWEVELILRAEAERLTRQHHLAG
jgi:hypothetical protein